MLKNPVNRCSKASQCNWQWLWKLPI